MLSQSDTIFTANPPLPTGTSAIQSALTLFGSPGQVQEIRALKRDGSGAVSFYSACTKTAAEWAARRDQQDKVFKGIYLVLNPFAPRESGRHDSNATKGADILRRWLIPIDADPVKPAGQDNATDQEKAGAFIVANNAYKGLIQGGFVGLTFGDSGNGYHSTIPTDLPSDEQTEQAIKQLFARLESRYGTAGAHIDQRLFDASRILKLPGTVARKGVSTTHRPHRPAGILIRPESITPDMRRTNSELLMSLLKQTTTVTTTTPALTPISLERFDASFNPSAHYDDADNLAIRVAAFLTAMPESIEGQNGSGRLWAVCMPLVEGFALSPADALAAMPPWNARCQPPWSDKELVHALTNASKKAGTGANPIGYLLSSSGTTMTTISTPAATVTATESISQAQADTWPKPISQAGFIGPIGEFILRVTAGSEADPSAALVAALVRYGCRIGRTARLRIGGSDIFPNEYALLVGPTSSGRKGTTSNYSKILFSQADEQRPDFNDPIAGYDTSGLSSGQGLIFAVRDAAGDDHGVDEKRLMVVEPELAKILAGCRGAESTLSATIRDFWDSGTAAILNKNTPVKATGASVSILAMVTPSELQATTTHADTFNGFLNRFLIVCCRRPGLVAMPPTVAPSQFLDQRHAIRLALESRLILPDNEIRFDDDAAAFWVSDAYPRLESARHGAAEALLARGAGHVLRLSVTFAVSENCHEIGVRHIQAALAVWFYVERSVKYLFGDSTGDAKADHILHELRAIPGGMTRLELHALTGRHYKSSDFNRIRSLLLQARLILVTTSPTAGRPVERWIATPQ